MEDLLEYLFKDEVFSCIEELTATGEKYIISGGGKTSFYALLISHLFKKLRKNFIVVLPDELSAEISFQDIKTFTANNEDVKFLPSPEVFLKEEESISPVMFERVGILTEIADYKKPFILVSQPLSLLKKIPLLREFRESRIHITTGGAIRRDFVISRLLDYGYDETDIVEEPGEFARRGSIVDIFPMNIQFPVRVEFSGNYVHSIRKFEPASQVSFERINAFTINPLNERFAGEERKNLVEQMGDIRIFVINPDIFSQSQLWDELQKKGYFLKQDFDGLVKKAVILKDKGYSSEKKEKFFYFNVFPVSERFNLTEPFRWMPFFQEKLFIFSDNTSQETRLKDILKEKGIDISMIRFSQGPISSGFSFPQANLTVLSNDELFGRYRVRRYPARHYAETIPIKSYSEIREGDYVVHYNEGIGIFRGMEKIKTGEKTEEFAVIEYERGDRLYLPLDQITLLHKYTGSNKPKLSTLGGKGWIKIREKVRESIRDLAADLYNLYTARKKERGFAFLPDEEFQQAFDSSFIYTETEDQQKAIEEVKRDMVSDAIMDRIVCGDSGYGKTEVALRASCKAVISGKQVAVLVPTTVLALQHFLTFRERFADFPVKVEMLSRILSQAEQKKVLHGIQNGSIDIVIGTHRLLQDDVKFKKLGLLIIDEEQRFGVVHKEKIKREFRGIDALTLTATPIPRTLYMSLSGLLDISVIETPPQGRLSVITYVGRYNENLIREAVLREIERKGQVFYLHNRIYDIERTKEKLSRILPFVPRIEVAHGRMDPVKLASIMERFSAGEIDILVATSIVENGIDVPRANTLIVDNAHTFGLADLYQLRGRVGRYKWRAYAYFLYPDSSLLSAPARERLSAIQQLNRPGSGYKIALKDLEIRGAGNILGREQHGFIEQVGFELYCRFWKDVMGEMKREKEPELFKRRTVPVIPDEYIKSPAIKFYLYRKIAEITSPVDVDILLEEMKDRFGPPPEELVLSLKNANL
ncbi:MAG TPA: transcription-repair coupling factor [bacterium]|nr:transcription-repair coupling factor [bacterium]